MITPAPSLWIIMEKLWVLMKVNSFKLSSKYYCCRLCLLPGDIKDPALFPQLRFISSVVSGPLQKLSPLLDRVWEHLLFRIQFLSPVDNWNISLLRPTQWPFFSFYRRTWQRLWERLFWHNPSLQPLHWHMDQGWTVDWSQKLSGLNYSCRYFPIQWHLLLNSSLNWNIVHLFSLSAPQDPKMNIAYNNLYLIQFDKLKT